MSWHQSDVAPSLNTCSVSQILLQIRDTIFGYDSNTRTNGGNTKIRWWWHPQMCAESGGFNSIKISWFSPKLSLVRLEEAHAGFGLSINNSLWWFQICIMRRPRRMGCLMAHYCHYLQIVSRLSGDLREVSNVHTSNESGDQTFCPTPDESRDKVKKVGFFWMKLKCDV